MYGYTVKAFNPEADKNEPQPVYLPVNEISAGSMVNELAAQDQISGKFSNNTGIFKKHATDCASFSNYFYISLVTFITDHMTNGKEDKEITIYDIAKRLKTSPATESCALQDHQHHFANR